MYNNFLKFSTLSVLSSLSLVSIAIAGEVNIQNNGVFEMPNVFRVITFYDNRGMPHSSKHIPNNGERKSSKLPNGHYKKVNFSIFSPQGSIKEVSCQEDSKPFTNFVVTDDTKLAINVALDPHSGLGYQGAICDITSISLKK